MTSAAHAMQLPPDREQRSNDRLFESGEYPMVRETSGSGHGDEDAHAPASAQVPSWAPGVHKAGTGRALSAADRKTLGLRRSAAIYRLAHERAGTTFAETARDLGGIDKRYVARLATPDSGKTPALWNVVAGPKAVEVETGWILIEDGTAVPVGRLVSDQLRRLLEATADCSRAERLVEAAQTEQDRQRAEADADRAEGVLRRETAILIALRARRGGR